MVEKARGEAVVGANRSVVRAEPWLESLRGIMATPYLISVVFKRHISCLNALEEAGQRPLPRPSLTSAD